MPRKRHKPEEIVAVRRARQVDVLVSQGVNRHAIRPPIGSECRPYPNAGKHLMLCNKLREHRGHH